MLSFNKLRDLATVRRKGPMVYRERGGGGGRELGEVVGGFSKNFVFQN